MCFLDRILIKMSDRLTTYSSHACDDQDDMDNLTEFLTKLAQFGINQCLHFEQLITNKQQKLKNSSAHNHQYKIYQNREVVHFSA